MVVVVVLVGCKGVATSLDMAKSVGRSREVRFGCVCVVEKAICENNLPNVLHAHLISMQITLSENRTHTLTDQKWISPDNKQKGLIDMAAMVMSSAGSAAAAAVDSDQVRAAVFADNTNRVFRDMLKPTSIHYKDIVTSIQASTLFCEHEIPRIPLPLAPSSSAEETTPPRATSALAASASASASAASVSLPPIATTTNVSASSAKRRVGTTRIEVVNMDLLECARMMIDRGLCANPAVHNMSSDKKAGGGVVNGRKAAEESACRRCTLFMSLDRYYRTMHAKHEQGAKSKKLRDWYAQKGMEDDELTYNPDVLVFRDVQDEMLPESQWWKVSFISSHAIRRPQLDKNDDRYMAKAIDAKCMKNKYRALLRLAHAQGHRSLVLSGWGSGAYRCPARHIAEIIFDLLFADPEFVGVFDNVFFSILDPYLATSNFIVYRETLAEYQDQYGVVATTAPAGNNSISGGVIGVKNNGDDGNFVAAVPVENASSNGPVLSKNQKRRLRKKLLAQKLLF